MQIKSAQKQNSIESNLKLKMQYKSYWRHSGEMVSGGERRVGRVWKGQRLVRVELRRHRWRWGLNVVIGCGGGGGVERRAALNGASAP